MKRFIIMGIAFMLICSCIAGCTNQPVDVVEPNEPTVEQIAAAYFDKLEPDLIYDEIVIGETRDVGFDRGELTSIRLYNRGELVWFGSINIDYYSHLLG
jgi:hypothetical protein